MQDTYYRPLEDLHVPENKEVGSLIEERATSFYQTTNTHPTTCVISPDVLTRIVDSFWGANTYSTRGFQVIKYMTAVGELEVLFTREHTQFMIVGIKDTYQNYKYFHSIPTELWGEDSIKRQVDEQFEEIVLKG